MREGDWKLIEWMEEGRSELFNLANDLSERHDQALVQARRVTELVDELHAWQTPVRARFPSQNTDYDSAKPSGRAATRKPTRATSRPSISKTTW